MSAPLDLDGDVVQLLRALIDVESVSGHEQEIADLTEQALRPYRHLNVLRDGNVVLARTELGRSERVVIAGHLDTVPVAGNLPSWTTYDSAGREIVWGRGACDMKGGIAVQLSAAAALLRPRRDITWIFYDNEEVEEYRNGLSRIAREHPEYLQGSFAVLCEPTNARIEGGCQGSMLLTVELTGLAAHSARPWMGRNAIHDAGPVLERLSSHQSQQIEVDGLTYREGLNAVRISGGIAGNIIPDRCVIEINYRFAPDKSPAEAEAYVREVFDGYSVRVLDVAAGARPGLDQPAAQEFLRAVGGEATAKLGWTDVARFSSMGIPAVNFGPGDPTKAHADDEFCPADDVVACRDGLLSWLS
ncbi:MAG TPA: succinyl-diaminopimelate desuccinylase [Propionibacteriaceae bacterium]|nr:succinyl-diaminopimelate desuccinylase [Propionibacteriaceae bacterium]